MATGIDRSMGWLATQRPKKDLLAVRKAHVTPLTEEIREAFRRKSLPFTIGLFGGWGSGKTSCLSLLAAELRSIVVDAKGGPPVLYFNAWRHAEYDDLLAALTYRILSHPDVVAANEHVEDLGVLLESLAANYSKDFGAWLEKKIGVDVVRLVGEVRDARENSSAVTQLKRAAETYFTRLDRIQEVVASALERLRLPMVILVDELDRCDPMEAFSALKRIRGLFESAGARLVFVVAANPEPIGHAVRHQYGLSALHDEFESKRILEKFFDSFRDLSDPVDLGPFAVDLWSEDSSDASLPGVGRIDRTLHGPHYLEDTVKNETVFGAMSTRNPYYRNLRVLRKAFAYRHGRGAKRSWLPWTVWHLEIVQQAHGEFARSVASAAPEIGWITANAHLAMIRTLSDTGSLRSAGSVFTPGEKVEIKSHKGETAFAVYRSWFWEFARKRAAALRAESRDRESTARADLLERWLASWETIDFLAIMSCLPGTVLDRLVDHGRGFSAEAPLENWRELEMMNHFSWLLATD